MGPARNDAAVAALLGGWARNHAISLLLVFRSHRVGPNIEWYPEKDGLDDPAWLKLANYLLNSVGNLGDRSDLALT